jgi:N-acyl homoserine lactone hydrolase
MRIALSFAVGLAACATLPPAPPHERVAPRLDAVPALEVCWLEYARREQPARRAHAGRSVRERWDITVAGLLIRHPKGDLLLDVGNSSKFATEIGDQRPFARAFLRQGPGKNELVATVGDALLGAGEEPGKLAAVVISHVHVDHAGGLVDLPDVPVLLDGRELEFSRQYRDRRTAHVVPAHADALEGRARPLALTDAPYQTFDRSLDYFGDGSVVFVQLSGHTPGSIGTFVNLSPDRRLFHVGDAINSTEALTLRVGKSAVMRVTDHDREQSEAMVGKLAQLQELDPALVIVPAHDRTAWEAFFGADVPRCIASEGMAEAPAEVSPAP